MHILYESTITCPACGHTAREPMPDDACQRFYRCPDYCCVFCSYGNTPCPDRQGESQAKLNH